MTTMSQNQISTRPRFQRRLIAGASRSLKLLRRRFFAPVDISSLVFFRIAFGAIMLWEVMRYFVNGWIRSFYIEPTFYFKYRGFSWIQPLPGDLMYLLFYLLGVLAICIMVGFSYRISAALFFIGFTYVFLLDQARYLNHFYLISLISFLLIFVPAHRAFSFDVRRRPERQSETAPAWTLWLLRAQLAIVYFYGGLAKLNSDWLRGEPLRMWLAKRADLPVFGSLLVEEWTVYLFAYGGLFFDLLIVPLLLWRRTRLVAFLWAISFHLLNATLFQIGIFPWFALAATLLFFPPDLPRRSLQFIRGLFNRQSNVETANSQTAFARQPSQRITIALFAIYFALQLLLPLRHFLYPGNVNWTEEGHRFSWRMKLREKKAGIRFSAYDPLTGATWEIEPREYLTLAQLREMKTRPDMILQFSHHLAQEMRRQGHENIEIRVLANAALNGRQPQLLIDPTINLAAQEQSLLPSLWIVPLTEPLPNRKSVPMNGAVDEN